MLDRRRCARCDPAIGRTRWGARRIGAGWRFALTVRGVRSGSVMRRPPCDQAHDGPQLEPRCRLTSLAMPWPVPQAQWIPAVQARSLPLEVGLTFRQTPPLRFEYGLLYLERYRRQEEQVRAGSADPRGAAAAPFVDANVLGPPDSFSGCSPGGGRPGSNDRSPGSPPPLVDHRAGRRAGDRQDDHRGPGAGAAARRPGPPLGWRWRRRPVRPPRASQGPCGPRGLLDEQDRATGGRARGASPCTGCSAGSPAACTRSLHRRDHRLPFDVVIVDGTSMVSLP